MKKHLLITITLAAIATQPSVAGLLVNLDATNKALGPLATWPQEAGASVVGNFTAGGAVPNVVTKDGVTCVELTGNGTLGNGNFYAGPSAPLTLSAPGAPRTFEVWAYNPTVEGEETLLAMGRRGGPGATNFSFNYGSNPVFGALGGWTDTFDVGWGLLPNATQWHHLVVTYDGTYTRFYSDGKQTNYERHGTLITHQNDANVPVAPLKFVVGGQNSNVSPFNPAAFNAGLFIAKVRVHDVALSPAEITSRYDAEKTSLATPAAVSLTAASTVFMPGEPVALSYVAANADSVTITPGPGTVPVGSGRAVVYPNTSPATYTLTASRGGLSTTKTITLSQLTSTAPLVHRWSFNEISGTAVIDSVGAPHGGITGAQNGTILGTAATTFGTAGQWARSTAIGTAAGTNAVRLGGGASGTSAYIDLPNGVMSGLTQVTFEGWMTMNGATAWARYFDFGTTTIGEVNAPGGAFNGREYMLISAQIGGTTTSRRLSMMDNGVETAFDVLNHAVTYNTQFHFAAVYDPLGNAGVSPSFRYYRDGVLAGTLNTGFRPQDLVFQNNWLGRSNWAGDANTNGTYNEFRIWTVPLTQAEITASIASGPDGAPPAIPSPLLFAAFPSYVSPGQPVRLSYVGNGSGAATVSIDNGVTVTSPTILSNYVTVNPVATTTYTLTVTDGASVRTATATVQVTSQPPLACPTDVFTPAETAVAIPLRAVTDAPNLAYTIVTQPMHGVLSGTAPNVSYLPAVGYSGPESFSWKVNNGAQDSAVAVVHITVGPPQAAPTDIVLDNNSLRTDDGVGNIVSRLQAVDVNSQDKFTWSLVSGAGDVNNAWFTINGNQLLSNHDFTGAVDQSVSLRLRATDTAGASFEKVVRFTVAAADVHVKINEILYNSANNKVKAEFVELYNPTGADVNLSGWHFSKGISFTFGNVTLPAGGYVVVAQNPSAIQSLFGVTAQGPWVGGLSSDGDELVLRNAAGVKVDGVEFSNNSPWPVPPNGNGPSLELVNPSLDNDLGGHWRSAVGNAGAAFISRGATGWRYRPNLTEVPTGWRLDGFAEGAEWRTGTSPVGMFKVNNNTSQAFNPETNVTLGTQLTAAIAGTAADMGVYSNANLNVDNNFTINYRSVSMRRVFNVASIPSSLLLRVLRTDAAIVWLNGVEVARFGFPENGPTEPAAGTTGIYEHSNDPWSEIVLQNTSMLQPNSNNIIAIQGWVKAPRLRGTQEDVAQYNTFDFALDLELMPVRNLFQATPGAANSTFAANCPPAVRQVDHSPNAPKSGEPITISAKVTDRQGIQSVIVKYQVLAAGAYIPAYQPRTPQDTRVIVGLAPELQYALAPHPEFENPDNWRSAVMLDPDGDGTFTAAIPGQAHRSLVRYRIVATDLASASVQNPLPDDPNLNHAVFVYNGVPDYSGPTALYTKSALETLPVYHWIMRPEDRTSLLAYVAAEQFANDPAYASLLARRYYNWAGAMVYDGKVYDHVAIRLRGGNSRYNGAGKRHFRFKFPKGNAFEAKDQKGRRYARDWEDMLFNKLFGNKGDYDWGLPYYVGAKLWGLQGVPTPQNHWVHFRMITGPEEAPSASGGDFWGLYQALELPDGRNFLKARNLPAGNFYKLSDWVQNGEMNERYQAPDAPDFAEDFNNIRYNIHQYTSDADMRKFVNMPLYYKYQSVVEGIRHYDIFVEPTGRHRVKNFYWYFHPGELNADGSRANPLGQCWIMPYDWDASFGPSWNAGQEVFLNAIYNYATFPESPSWPAAGTALVNRSVMQIERRNAIREFRDLLMHRNDVGGTGPVDYMITDAQATLNPFWRADQARWPAPGANSYATPPGKATDMLNFCFVGWSTIAGEPAVGAGGRVAYMDSISDAIDAGQLPAKPTVSFSGTSGFPVDGLSFTASAYSDPQLDTPSAIEWRAGEISNPASVFTGEDRAYEVEAVWSTRLTTNTTAVAIPSVALAPGKTYRVRARYLDSTGRASHWSDPVQFAATPGSQVDLLRENLVVSEILYKPAPLRQVEVAAGYEAGSFEFIELRNLSTAISLNLSDVRLSDGVGFTFPAGFSLAPGGRTLVVANQAALLSRYPSLTAANIAGTWNAGDNLNNGGETITLVYGATDVLRSFSYLDSSPWPVEGDIAGTSIVYAGPKPTLADVTDPQDTGTNWRGTFLNGGTPAGTDTPTLAEWMAGKGLTDPAADPDKNGMDHCTEFAFGLDLHPFEIRSEPFESDGKHYLGMSYTRRVAQANTTFHPEISTTLTAWSAPAGATLEEASISNGDGTETVHVRTSLAIEDGVRYFLRVRAAHQ